MARQRFPRWFFALLAIGGLLASGIYIGLIRSGDASTGTIIRALAFGIMGLLMFCGALSKHG